MVFVSSVSFNPLVFSQEKNFSVDLASSSKVAKRKIVDATIEVLKNSATMAIDVAGKYTFKGSWKIFRPIFFAIGDELKKHVPKLFDSRLKPQETKIALNQAAKILSTDSDLQDFLIGQFTSLQSGQTEILVQLGVLNAKVDRIEIITQEILHRIKLRDPVEYVPVKGLGYIQEVRGGRKILLSY